MADQRQPTKDYPVVIVVDQYPLQFYIEVDGRKSTGKLEEDDVKKIEAFYAKYPRGDSKYGPWGNNTEGHSCIQVLVWKPGWRRQGIVETTWYKVPHGYCETIEAAVRARTKRHSDWIKADTKAKSLSPGRAEISHDSTPVFQNANPGKNARTKTHLKAGDPVLVLDRAIAELPNATIPVCLVEIATILNGLTGWVDVLRIEPMPNDIIPEPEFDWLDDDGLEIDVNDPIFNTDDNDSRGTPPVTVVNRHGDNDQDDMGRFAQPAAVTQTSLQDGQGGGGAGNPSPPITEPNMTTSAPAPVASVSASNGNGPKGCMGCLEQAFFIVACIMAIIAVATIYVALTNLFGMLAGILGAITIGVASLLGLNRLWSGRNKSTSTSRPRQYPWLERTLAVVVVTSIVIGIVLVFATRQIIPSGATAGALVILALVVDEGLIDRRGKKDNWSKIVRWISVVVSVLIIGFLADIWFNSADLSQGTAWQFVKSYWLYGVLGGGAIGALVLTYSVLAKLVSTISNAHPWVLIIGAIIIVLLAGVGSIIYAYQSGHISPDAISDLTGNFFNGAVGFILGDEPADDQPPPPIEEGEEDVTDQGVTVPPITGTPTATPSYTPTRMPTTTHTATFAPTTTPNPDPDGDGVLNDGTDKCPELPQGNDGKFGCPPY